MRTAVRSLRFCYFYLYPPHLTLQQTELAKKDDLYSKVPFVRIAEMDN